MASSRHDRMAYSSSALEPTVPEQLGAGPSDNGRGGRSPLGWARAFVALNVLDLDQTLNKEFRAPCRTGS